MIVEDYQSPVVASTDLEVFMLQRESMEILY